MTKTKITVWQLLNKSCVMNKQRRIKRSQIISITILMSIALSAGVIGNAQVRAEKGANFETSEVNVPAKEKQLKIFNRQQVVKQIIKEGERRDYDLKTIDNLIRLSVCESGLNQFFTLRNDDQKKTIDRGIYAINDKWNPDVRNDMAFDVDYSIKYTFDIYDKKSGDIGYKWYCWPRVLKNPDKYPY